MCNRIIFSTIAFLFVLCGNMFAQSMNQSQLDYILKYKSIAISEMERSSIPASITLAQGILESTAGTSWLAVEGNNHFGIKCGSDWYGETIYKKDDDLNEHGELIMSCFRKYGTAEESFEAHSDFLHHPNKPWYLPLFDLDITDYKGWAEGLLKAGYASNPQYPQLLIGIIERYNLQQYDALGTSKPDLVATNVGNGEEDYLYKNRIPYTEAQTGERLASVAFRTGVSVRQLVKYNDGLTDGNQTLVPGQIIYLKHKKWNNTDLESPYHTVQPGETMVDISQKYGVSLFWLHFKNKMKEGEQPAAGTRIKIRGPRVKDAPALARPGEPLPDVDEIADDTYVDWEVEPVENPVKPIVIPIPDREEDPQPQVEQPVTYKTYIVKKGDTLWKISQMNGLTVDELKRLNNMSGNIISVGQVLKVWPKA